MNIQNDSTRTSLPWKQMLVLSLINLNEAFQINVIWPFVPFMVDGFHIAPPSKGGTYVGILASSFFVAQFISSFLWGWASDVFGRRPTLLIGLLGTFFSILAFGISQTYFIAVISRFAGGLLNGNIGITKTYLGEITNASNQAAGFSLLAFTWGFGSIIAPSIGGFLVHPEQTIPSLVSKDSVFAKYPYLLPCAVSSIVSIVGFITGVLYLPETQSFNQSRVVCKKKPEQNRTNGRLWVKSKMEHSIEYSVLNQDSHEWDADVTEESINEGNGRTVSNDISLDSIENFATVCSESNDYMCTENPQMPIVVIPDDHVHESIQLLEDESESSKPSQLFKENETVRAKSALEPLEIEEPKTYTHPWIISSCSSYGVCAFVYVLWDEVFPIFCKTIVPNGGLSFSTGNIGMALSIQGVALIIYQSLFFSHICNSLGPSKAFRLGMIGFSIISLLFPLTTYVADLKSNVMGLSPSAVMWTVMSIILIAKALTAATAFTAVMMLVNNSALHAKRRLGTVNGVAQSCSAFTRAVGPMAGGALWSLSISLKFPFHTHLLYILISASCFFAAHLSIKLPKFVDRPPDDIFQPQEGEYHGHD